MSTVIEHDFCLVHGVNTGKHFPYGQNWLTEIASHLEQPTKVYFANGLGCYTVEGHVNGLKHVFRAVEVRWDSQDNPVVDWMRLRLDNRYRENAQRSVDRGIAEWLLRNDLSSPRIIAHSMGVPLALDTYWRLCEGGAKVSFTGIGGPMTHPVLGRLLEARGLGVPNGRKVPKDVPKPKAFSNREDYICALWTPFGNMWRERPYFDRAEVEIDALPTREHDAEKYLALPEVFADLTGAPIKET